MSPLFRKLRCFSTKLSKFSLKKSRTSTSQVRVAYILENEGGGEVRSGGRSSERRTRRGYLTHIETHFRITSSGAY